MDLQKQYGNLYKLWMGPRLHLMVTKPESVEFFLNSTVHLSKSSGYDLFKPWLGDGLLVSTGSKWRSRRKMITPTFHFKILEQFMDVFNNQLNILSDILTKEVETNGNIVELHSPINLCSLDIICGKGNYKIISRKNNVLLQKLHSERPSTPNSRETPNTCKQ